MREDDPAMLAAMQAVTSARRDGTLNWSGIASFYGVNRSMLRRKCDPDYREKDNAKKAGWRSRRHKRLLPTPTGVHVRRSITKQEYAARLAEIPPDTRTFTQRFFGDPIPNDPRRANDNTEYEEVRFDG